MGEYKPTAEQKLALETKGNNILVSAGAGSGKTRVLTERILNYVKSGVDIQSLLVLTFTKNAAAEMKSRIRKGLIDEPSLKDQLLKIETAPITNFDSFSLSFVKKYYYLLDIDKNINLGDESFFLKKKRDLLTDIFNEYYEANDEEFYQIIKSNGEKDDKDIFESIIDMYEKISLKANFKEFLDNLYDKNFKVKEDIELYHDYMKSILMHIYNIKEIYYSLGEFNEYLNKNKLSELFELNEYDEIKAYFTKYPNFVRKPNKFQYSNEHESMKDSYDAIKKMLSYENMDELINELTYSSKHANIFYKTLIKLDEQMMEYKKSINTYQFGDIAKMAIKILKENPIIREENVNKYYEILVDEYQDTSDIQEEFIRLLSNNNIYMVGDIKQSIYRFRNANCDIFKDKYLNYSKNNGGIKIDMTNNFRSRKGIISHINSMFDVLMNMEYGGADYPSSHHMKAANKQYEEEGKKDFDDSLVVLHYDKDSVSSDYDKMCAEAIIIANDIKDKINSGYLIYDDSKEVHALRPVTYNDFAIICATNGHFELFKEVFDDLNVPLQVFQNESVTNSQFLYVISNLLLLYKYIYENDFSSPQFRHAFLSVGRSVLFDYNDQELFDIIKENKIYNSLIYKKMQNVIYNYKDNSNINIFNAILNEFDVYNSIVRDYGVNDANISIEFVINKIISLESSKTTFIEFAEYLSCLLKESYKMERQGVLENSNSVTLMNIHKSKGLEFKIIYFYDLSHKFNFSDLKRHYNFSDDYGFLINKNGESPLRVIANYNLRKEEISEKVRLFYVALTRAKESMIFVTHEEFGEDRISDQINDNSFFDFLLRLSSYIKNNNVIKEVDLTYPSNFLNTQYKEEDTSSFELEEKEIKVNYKDLDKGHASNVIKEIISKDTYNMLHEGTKFHEILESLDLKNPDFTNIDEFYVNKIKAFLGKVNLENAIIYQEHEFYINIDNKEINGIIDLLLEYDDQMVIIDYKLSNASVEKYREQLNIYRQYVNSVSTKPCKTYLYSLLKEELVEVK